MAAAPALLRAHYGQPGQEGGGVRQRHRGKRFAGRLQRPQARAGDERGARGPLAPGAAPRGQGARVSLPAPVGVARERVGPLSFPEPATPAARGQDGGRGRHWMGFPPAARPGPAPRWSRGILAKGQEG